MSAVERFANWVADLLGHGFDPNADVLPAFPDEKKKTATVKKQADGGNVYVLHDSTFGFKSHPAPGEEKNLKGNAAELTERDAGEILAYSKTQKLTNQELAAAVKAGISQGKTAAEIALETGYSQSTIEKYKAALSRANDVEK